MSHAPSDRAADRAYKAIRSAILSQRWDGGSHLPEKELAAFTGVSRTPVREALRRLEADGLLELTPNAGARICTWSAEDLHDIFCMRSLLEGYAARMAATRIRPASLDCLRALCDSMEALVEAAVHEPAGPADLTRLNHEFHGLIIEESGSRRVRQALQQIVRGALVMRTFAVYGAADLRRSMAHHREVTEALRAGDPVWAESVMRAHLHAGYAVLKTPDGAIDPAGP